MATLKAMAAQRDDVRAKVEQQERLLVATAESVEKERHSAELRALRMQLAEAEALVTALKVGSPRRLCIRGEYIDNPSAPSFAAPSPATRAGTVLALATARVGPRNSGKKKQQRADSATTDSPKRSGHSSLFERDRERVAARDKWLAERRQAELDETLAEATFSPRIHKRRYKPSPPVRSAVAGKTAKESDNQSPSDSPAAQAVAARRFQAENGYWPGHEDLLVYIHTKPQPETKQQLELQAEPVVRCDDVHTKTEKNEQLRVTAAQHSSDLDASRADAQAEMGSPVPPLRISLQQYVTARTHRVAKGLAIQASHRSHPSYGRSSPAILPASVDSAHTFSPTTLAHETGAAARSVWISAPCLNTPLASPVRSRPRTAGSPISDSWPSPKEHSEQNKGDCSGEFPFTPQIAVHHLKGDRLARRLTKKPATRARLQFLASRHPSNPLRTMPHAQS